MTYNAFRLTDLDTGGDSMVTGSPNVFTNTLKQTRVGDIDSDTPPDVMVTGSKTVFTNNRRTCRYIDIDNDKESGGTYSPNVFIGD